MKAIVIDAGPRRNWNTAQMVEKAAEGAKSAGAEVEVIRLYDYNYKGCQSCFACKLKTKEQKGLCAIQDELKPVLEKVLDADVLIMGSPIYYGNVTGELFSFLERIFFPAMLYERHEDNTPVLVTEKQKKCGLILTMNVAESMLDMVGYRSHFALLNDTISRMVGPCETLYSCDTLQFTDYSKYYAGMFNEEAKRAHHEKQFPVDLQNAFDLGKKLCE